MDFNANDPTRQDGFANAPTQKPRRKRRGCSFIIILIIISVVFGTAVPALKDITSDEEFFGRTVLKPAHQFDEAATDTEDLRDTTHFSEMEYLRPELDTFFSSIDRVKSECSVLSSQEIIPILKEIYDSYSNFNSMFMLASIKNSTDVTDEYYYNEHLWLTQQAPLADQQLELMHYALASSPIADDLEKEYYGIGYFLDYSGTSPYTDELVRLYQEEARIILEYQTAMGNATVTMHGEEVQVVTYLAENADNNYDYIECSRRYYEEYGALCAGLYAELVAVRHGIAAELGYDSYIDCAYAEHSRDYTAEDIQDYLDTLKTGITPLYRMLYDSGELFDYRMPGNLSEEKNMASLRSAAEEMGGEIYDIFLFMEEYGLYDISVSGTKENISFQSYIEEWDAPFLTLNANGTLDDYISFAHEFGHYVDAYINRNLYMNTDIGESCSQAMEFLAILYSSALGEDQGNATHMKMVNLVSLYAEQGAYNAFEEAVYSIPVSELTAEKITETAHDVFTEYGLLTADVYGFYDNMWIDVAHFFSHPFYIVSYITSNDAAFQIYEKELETPGSGIEMFLAMATRDRQLNYLANLRNCGLDPSLSAFRAQKIVDSICEYFE